MNSATEPPREPSGSINGELDLAASALLSSRFCELAQHLHGALNKLNPDSDPLLWAEINCNLGVAILRISEPRTEADHEEATVRLRQALSVYERADMVEQMAVIHENLGVAYSSLHRSEWGQSCALTLRHFAQAVECWRRIGQINAVAELEDNIAQIHSKMLSYLELAIYLRQSALHEPLITPEDCSKRVEQAISIYNQLCVAETNFHDPAFSLDLNVALGVALLARTAGDLAENTRCAIECFQTALNKACRETNPVGWANIQINLAYAYERLLRYTPANLDDARNTMRLAIHHSKQALQEIRPDTNLEDWLAIKSRVAWLLYTDARLQSEASQSQNKFDEAIEQTIGILTYAQRGDRPVLWAQSQQVIGLAYKYRKSQNNRDDLEYAISCLRRAYDAFSAERFQSEIAVIDEELGDLFVSRIAGEPVQNFETAASHFERALKAAETARDAARAADIHRKIGVLHSADPWKDSLDHQEAAILHLETAAAFFAPETSPDFSTEIQSRLAHVFSRRLKGDPASNQERAIHHGRRAAALVKPERYKRELAMIQNVLAQSYANRASGSPPKNAETAITRLFKALSATSKENARIEWGILQHNLGNAYAYHTESKDLSDIEKAISHYEEALTVRIPATDPYRWAMTQACLGNMYFLRQQRSGTFFIGDQVLEDVDTAMWYFRRALQVFTRETYPRDWARVQIFLAEACAFVSKFPSREDATRDAIALLEIATEVGSAHLHPELYAQSKMRLGELYAASKDWSAAHVAYSAAIEAKTGIFADAYTEAGRRKAVATISSVYTADARCLLQLGKPAEAFVRLDQGRASVLNDALSIRDLDIAALTSEEAVEIREARATLRSLSRESWTVGGEWTEADLVTDKSWQQARDRLHRVTDALRFERPDLFPAALDDIDELLKLAPRDGALVAPLIGPDLSVAFVVPFGSSRIDEENVLRLPPGAAMLPDLLLGRGVLAEDSAAGHSDELRTLFQEGGWLRSYAMYVENSADEEYLSKWRSVIDGSTELLWRYLMGPISEHLVKLGLGNGAPVVLLRPPDLSLFPLHAAWRGAGGARQYFSDLFSVSYALSGYAMSVGHRRLAEPHRQYQSALVVANPTMDLHFATLEGRAVRALLGEQTRLIEEVCASAAALLSGAPAANYIHFAGHARHDWLNPFGSALLLSGGSRLELSDIITRLDLGSARLVVLSACETGLSDIRKAPEELVGLPAGFIQAGAPAVLSTLWPVNDISTMLLMERFYTLHVRAGATIGGALREAQVWLRDASARSLADHIVHLQNIYPELGGDKLAMAGRHFAELTPDHKPFASPFFWAAFQFTGV